MILTQGDELNVPRTELKVQDVEEVGAPLKTYAFSEPELAAQRDVPLGGAEAARVALFLDEIGNIGLDLQPRLLRAVQEQEFEGLGSATTIKVDVRFIVATHRDLRIRIAGRGGAAERLGLKRTTPKKEVGLALAIVWRNPNCLIRTRRTLHRVHGDQFGVVYTVTDPIGTVEFSLKSGSKTAT